MTTSNSILILLATEQGTTEGIALKLRQPPVVIAAFCCDLETSGLVVSAYLGNPEAGRKLITWRLTEKGKTRAAELNSIA